MKKYIVASSHMASLIGRLVRTLCLLLLGTFFHSRATLHWMLRVAVVRKMHIIRAEGKLEPPSLLGLAAFFPHVQVQDVPARESYSGQS